MLHGSLIGGTSYEIMGGKTFIGGTGYSVVSGKTCIEGAGYNISFLNGTLVYNGGTDVTLGTLTGRYIVSVYNSSGTAISYTQENKSSDINSSMHKITNGCMICYYSLNQGSYKSIYHGMYAISGVDLSAYSALHFKAYMGGSSATGKLGLAKTLSTTNSVRTTYTKSVICDSTDPIEYTIDISSTTGVWHIVMEQYSGIYPLFVPQIWLS